MGHIPNAKRGMEIILDQNDDIMDDIAHQSDIAMAKQNKDRDASLVAIKERHANELKSAKRNHKHRAKKIKLRMKHFEDMDPVELADLFKHGVPEGTVSSPSSGVLRDHQIDAINALVGADLSSIEKRLIHHMMIPTGRIMGTGRNFGVVDQPPKVELQIKAGGFDIETQS
tara:strand:+ start:18675 stop:19187 length:513 start_codon:yes stop_codon:yes gene_type:complete